MDRNYVSRLFLPTSIKEARERGWEELDVILFSGDAYVDHPSFAAAVVGRYLESMGLKVAIVPQPNWRDDLRDFKKMGRPKLFFGVSAGAMDSMINKYTAARRLRSQDAYTPDRRIDMRPEYPTIVYTQILKKLFPDVPVVVGGIEASLRRLAHYDYWQDKLLPSFLTLSGADLLIYGMGELPLKELVERMSSGEDISSIRYTIRQCAYWEKKELVPSRDKDIVLHSYEACQSSKRKQAENFKYIETESNRWHADRLLQETQGKVVVVNPPYPPMTTDEIDASFDLPYMRLPHPRYKGKEIPAYDMIKHSINLHRGCFGGCAFCTISAHQGKFIASRSQRSILDEVRQVVRMDDFKGYLSDVGGPSANMYQIRGSNLEVCAQCRKPSCIAPKICGNLNIDYTELNQLLETIDKEKGIKKSFISSGIRYDMLLHRTSDEKKNHQSEIYTERLIAKHISGRLKVAPEHVSDRVLSVMRKPSFDAFYRFVRIFDEVNKRYGLKQEIIPYFISSHPGCQVSDMAQLAIATKRLNFHLEQVQDFTPTPMTLATEIFYTGLDPYTMEPMFCAKNDQEKQDQRRLFFWYKREERDRIINSLKKNHAEEYIGQLFPSAPSNASPSRGKSRRSSSSPKRSRRS